MSVSPKTKCAAARVRGLPQGGFHRPPDTLRSSALSLRAVSVAAQEATVGYSLSVPRFGFVPEINFARSYLFRASDALDAGNVTGAGVYLREAVRRQCWAECQWFDCLPEGATERTPASALLRALEKAGCTDDCGLSVARECIEYGNNAAHCRRVNPGWMRAAIRMFHNLIDATPCNEPFNMAGLPKPAECFIPDDDEFDPADWWKSEGGAA